MYILAGKTPNVLRNAWGNATRNVEAAVPPNNPYNHLFSVSIGPILF